MIAEKPLAYEHINSIPNDNPKLGNSYSGYTLMRKSEEGESRNTRYSAIDYISALAKPACSFVCMRNDQYQNNDSQVPFSLVPFGFLKTKYVFRFLPLQEIAVMWHRITSIFKRSILRPMMILDGQMRGNTNQCWEM